MNQNLRPVKIHTSNNSVISGGPTGIFGANTDYREQEHSNICYICIYTCIIMDECGHQILVTKICNRGRICEILTNFIPNMSALNSKHLIHYYCIKIWLLNIGLPSDGQTV